MMKLDLRQKPSARARGDSPRGSGAIDVYEHVLRASGARFPYRFFKGERGLERAAEITRYLIREKLRIPVADIPDLVTFRDVFLKFKLASMVNTIFGGSTYGAVNNAFPGDFEPWEGTLTPKGFWQGKEGVPNARKAVRWLVEKRLALHPESLPRKLTAAQFSRHKLDRLFKAFDGSIFHLVELVYPGRYKPWQFKRGRVETAESGETAKRAVRWLVTEKLGLDPSAAPHRVARADFYNHHLDDILDNRYKGSVARALEDAWPGRFAAADYVRTPGPEARTPANGKEPDEPIGLYEDVLAERRKSFPYRYFKLDAGRERAAVIFRFFVAEKLRISEREIPSVVTMRLLKKYRLAGLCSSLGRSIRDVVQNAYPGTFPPHAFRDRRRRLRQEKTVRSA